MSRLCILPFVFLLMALWQQDGFAHKEVEKPEVAYHQRIAQRYQKKALQQEIEIRKHIKMKEEYKKQPFFKKESDFYLSNLDQINKYCDAVISAAQELKKEYESFAAWHKQKAIELKTGGINENIGPVTRNGPDFNSIWLYFINGWA